jgi:Tol biopolymer transport system component
VPSEIWFASAEEDRKLYPVIQRQPFDTAAPAFSPDGKYLAFSSNDTGRQEVYVQAIECLPTNYIRSSS